MKKLLFLLLLLPVVAFNNVVSGQCTVHLFSKGWQSTVTLDGKMLTGLNKDEALEYTFTDGGRHTFEVKFADGFSAVQSFATDKESDLYYVAYQMVYPVRASKIKTIDLKEWNKEQKNFKDLIKMEQEESK